MDKYIEFLGLKKEGERRRNDDDDGGIYLYYYKSKIPESLKITLFVIINLKWRLFTCNHFNKTSRNNSFLHNEDIILNKKKIGKYLGEHKKTIKDRVYNITELKKILDACNLKYKVVVTMMASTGCRIGAKMVFNLIP